MRTLKEIYGLLIVVGIIAVFGQFLPGLNVLFDDYFAGFLLAAIVIPVARMMYKSHMDKIATLSPEVRQKKKKRVRNSGKKRARRHFLSQSRSIFVI